ncbi:hypothetical protein pipiens_011014 [Culex pipiens pipiens]|uniref:Uncharacterized protein n=1 Tax=Culex pipiens pipiens TaxID=38569 RepID=A0ABD1D7X3_CULPP
MGDLPNQPPAAMKFLIVALSALALASAQTTTTNIPLSVVGNADGSATIKIGAVPAIQLPATAVTAAKGVIGLISTVATGVTAGSNQSTNLAVTTDATTGAITVSVLGQTLTLDKTTIRSVFGILKNVKKAIAAGIRRPVKGWKGGKSRKHSNERRH